MRMSKLDLIVKEISKLYFLALRNLNLKSFSSGERDEFSPFLKYYSDVEAAFKILNEEQKRIVNNDYFHQAYPYWWESIYSKSKYNKKKKESLSLFVEAFYEIH